jgi:hypothetical protein
MYAFVLGTYVYRLNTYQYILISAYWVHTSTSSFSRCWGGQALWTVLNTMSLCGSCSEHGGQNPPVPLHSGWQCYSKSPTIPHKSRKNKNSCFPAGCAEASSELEDGRRSSNVYTVWLWQFGRGKPSLGGLTTEKTSDRQDSASKASDKRLKETREGCKDDHAWLGIKCECDLCVYILVHTRHILGCAGLNKAVMKLCEQTFLWVLPVRSDTGCGGRVHGGTQALAYCLLPQIRCI